MKQIAGSNWNLARRFMEGRGNISRSVVDTIAEAQKARAEAERERKREAAARKKEEAAKKALVRSICDKMMIEMSKYDYDRFKL